MLKKIYFITFMLLLGTHVLVAGDVEVKGVELSKAKSIQRVLDGINQLRGAQNVILYLDDKKALNIIDSSTFVFDPVVLWVDGNNKISLDREARLSKKELSELLERLGRSPEVTGSDVIPVILFFDKSVSGSEGLKVLNELADHGLCLLQIGVQNNFVEREGEKKKLPSPPEESGVDKRVIK